MVALSTLNWNTPIGAPGITADDRKIGVVTDTDVYELLAVDAFLFRRVYALNLIDVDRYDDGALRFKLTADEAIEQRGIG